MDDISHGSDNDTGSESNGGHLNFPNHYFANNASSKSNMSMSNSNLHLLANSNRLSVDLNLQQAAAHSHLLSSTNGNRITASMNNRNCNSDLSHMHQLKMEPGLMFSNTNDGSLNGTPAPSESGNDMNDSGSVVRTRRRKAGISEEDRLCVVCGEPASGYNFDRLTCESCKAFFRRNAFKMKEKIKACSRGGKCDVTGSQRKHCPSCRLDKCFNSGMKKELILPPEKLEQRAKPRRRKHPSLSCDENSGMPNLSAEHQDAMMMRHQQMISSATPSKLSRNSVANNNQLTCSALGQTASPHRSIGNKSSDMNSRFTFPNYQLPVSSDFEFSLLQNTARAPSLIGQQSQASSQRANSSYGGPYGPGGPLLTQNTASPDLRNGGVDTGQRHDWGSLPRDGQCSRPDISAWESSLSDKDQDMYDRLTECLERLREPFNSKDRLESNGTAETLEDAYNRMETCIRRIIQVVKMIPYFEEIGRDAQIFILKANMYGLIILYSSFFFEKNISKLCYPFKSADGQLSCIRVSMLDDVSVFPVAALSSGGLFGRSNTDSSSGRNGDKTDENGDPLSPITNERSCVIREDFELYKRNTLAAFTELQDLANRDDYIRVCMLALKLFSTEYLPNDLRPTVEAAQSTYLVFLQRYLTCRMGRLSASRLYPRLLMAFIDIRTLEVRMTDFAKLLRMDGLSPLMREVISQK